MHTDGKRCSAQTHTHSRSELMLFFIHFPIKILHHLWHHQTRKLSKRARSLHFAWKTFSSVGNWKNHQAAAAAVLRPRHHDRSIHTYTYTRTHCVVVVVAAASCSSRAVVVVRCVEAQPWRAAAREGSGTVQPWRCFLPF